MSDPKTIDTALTSPAMMLPPSKVVALDNGDIGIVWLHGNRYGLLICSHDSNVPVIGLTDSPQATLLTSCMRDLGAAMTRIHEHLKGNP